MQYDEVFGLFLVNNLPSKAGIVFISCHVDVLFDYAL